MYLVIAKIPPQNTFLAPHDSVHNLVNLIRMGPWFDSVLWRPRCVLVLGIALALS